MLEDSRRFSMTLKKIRLELARDREHPDGSNRHGYEFVGPLDEQGHLDAVAWKKYRERCRVKRFWLNEADESGIWSGSRAGNGPSITTSMAMWMTTKAAIGSEITNSRSANMSPSASTTTT